MLDGETVIDAGERDGPRDAVFLPRRHVLHLPRQARVRRGRDGGELFAGAVGEGGGLRAHLPGAAADRRRSSSITTKSSAGALYRSANDLLSALFQHLAKQSGGHFSCPPPKSKARSRSCKRVKATIYRLTHSVMNVLRCALSLIFLAFASAWHALFLAASRGLVDLWRCLGHPSGGKGNDQKCGQQSCFRHRKSLYLRKVAWRQMI